MSFDDIISQLIGNADDVPQPIGAEDDTPVRPDYLGGYRDAIAFTRALTAGDGDGAVEIYTSASSEMTCALAQLLDDVVHSVSRMTDTPVDSIYTTILNSVERNAPEL